MNFFFRTLLILIFLNFNTVRLSTRTRLFAANASPILGV